MSRLKGEKLYIILGIYVGLVIVESETKPKVESQRGVTGEVFLNFLIGERQESDWFIT